MSWHKGTNARSPLLDAVRVHGQLAIMPTRRHTPTIDTTFYKFPHREHQTCAVDVVQKGSQAKSVTPFVSEMTHFLQVDDSAS